MPHADPTFHYYEPLLRYLRPAGCGRVEDPAVEKLFEGMAFLMGRVEQRLDNGLPELTEGLVNML